MHSAHKVQQNDLHIPEWLTTQKESCTGTLINAFCVSLQSHRIKFPDNTGQPLHTKVWSSMSFIGKKTNSELNPQQKNLTQTNKTGENKRSPNQTVPQYFGRAGFGRGHFPPSTSALNMLHFRASAWPTAFTIRMTQLINAISHAQSSVNNRHTQSFH